MTDPSAYCARPPLWLKRSASCSTPRYTADDIHRRLKAQAALAGQSLNEFLLARDRAHQGTRRLQWAVELGGDTKGARPALIVVDASVLTDFLLGRRHTLEAIEQEFIDDAQSPMHAPELIEPEALNALRRLVVAERITEQRALEAVADLDDVRLVRYPHAPLRPRVWELRHSLTAYDAAYLSLAEALEGSVLMTADGGLAAQASNSLGADRVNHVR